MSMRNFLYAAVIATAIFLSASPAAAVNPNPLDASTLRIVSSRFGKLIELANRHDLKELHKMFWQSPSVLIVAKSAIPADGEWAGFWGNNAVDQKLHDIAAAGPAILQPDFSKLKVVGLTHDVAESYAPVNITVSYAGQSGTPKPFLMIITWMRIENDWNVASEVILPVPPPPAATSPEKHRGCQTYVSSRPLEDAYSGGWRRRA